MAAVLFCTKKNKFPNVSRKRKHHCGFTNLTINKEHGRCCSSKWWYDKFQICSNWFLDKNKAENIKNLEDEMLTVYLKMGCKMHYSYSHLFVFLKHQNLSTLEKRYQRSWNANILGAYC